MKKDKDEQENTDEEADMDEELAFPLIEVPKGCKLVTVKYGINDGEEVEIISGLKQGDIVVFDPERQNKDLEATSTSTPVDVEAIEDLDDGKKNNKDGNDKDNKESKDNKENIENKSSEKPSVRPKNDDAITPKKDEKADNMTEEEARRIIDEITMSM